MRNAFPILWNLCAKDIRLFMVDKRSVLMFFTVPILLASLFGYLFGKPLQNGEIKLPLLVVLEDDHPLAVRIGQALLNSDKLQAVLANRSEAIQRIGKRSSRLALVLPQGFSNQIMARKNVPPVEILHHPGCSMEARWAEGVFTELAFREAAPELLGAWLPPGVKLKLERPFEVIKESVPNHMTIASQAYSHSFNGMTLQYLLFWGMDCGLMFLREQRQGIWKRLRSAPVSLTLLLLGKMLSTSVLALAQILVTFTFGFLVFGIPVNGSIPGFLAMVLVAAAMSAATGLLVASLGGNENRARSISILSILFLSMIGGMWLPSFMFPEWVQRLAIIFPTTWMVRGLEGVTMQTMGFADALAYAGVVGGFAVGFLLLANLRFRWLNTHGFSGGGS